LAKGEAPQLLRGVKKFMKKLQKIKTKQVTAPKYSTPAIQN
jgi:tricorn protease